MKNLKNFQLLIETPLNSNIEIHKLQWLYNPFGKYITLNSNIEIHKSIIIIS